MLYKLISALCIGICLVSNSQAERLDTSPQALEQYKTAMNFLLGRKGQEKSPQKAATIFKSLAEQNLGPAQHMLGNLYFTGKGVEKNNLLAYKWLSIAARDNPMLAKIVLKKRNLLKSRLSRMGLQQVEQWIKDWQPRPQHDLAAVEKNL